MRHKPNYYHSYSEAFGVRRSADHTYMQWHTSVPSHRAHVCACTGAVCCDSVSARSRTGDDDGVRYSRMCMRLELAIGATRMDERSATQWAALGQVADRMDIHAPVGVNGLSYAFFFILWWCVVVEFSA